MKIFILAMIIGITISLRTNEICKNNKQEECTGSYNSFHEYKLNCKQLKCQGSHPFHCNEVYCTNNAKSCIDFYTSNRPSISTLRLPHRPNSNSLYAIQIKDCKLKDYKLEHQDICLNNRKCISFKKNSNKYTIFLQKSSKLETHCPCKGKYNFHCGKKYCTINSLVCDHLLKTRLSNKTPPSISKCMIHHNY